MPAAYGPGVLRLLRLISYPQLRASWGRTLLVIGGIATGVSLIVAIAVVNTTVLANFRHTIDLIAGPAQLEVMLGSGEVGFDERVLDTIRRDPDVIAAVPLARGTMTLADEPTEALQLFGVDLTAEEHLRRYEVQLATERREAMRALENTSSVFVTQDFATRHHLSVGDTVALSAPAGTRDYAITGLLATEGLAAALGGQLVIMDLPSAQVALRKEGRIDQVDLMLSPTADVETVRDRMQRLVGDALNVARPEQRGRMYERMLSSFQAMLTGLSTLCLVAGVFIIYNTTSTGALRRANVLAELRVLGAESAQLFRLLMIEAVALGAIGTACGTLSGILMGKLLTGMVVESMGIIYQLRFPVSEMRVDVARTMLIAFVGIASAAFASYFAARRVAALDPLAVARRTALGATFGASPRRFLSYWLAMVAVSSTALVAQEHFKSAALGNLGSTLWNASVIVIAVPILIWSGGLLRRALPHLFAAQGRVAVDSLLRHPVRTGVTMAAIALTLTVGIMLASLAFSFRRSMDNYVGKFLADDLVVSATSTEGGWLEIPVPGELVDAIAAVPGVRKVETGRVLSGQPFRGERIGVLALSDGMFDLSRYPEGWFHEGDPASAVVALRAGAAVNVSTALADRFALHVGDRIALDTPTGELVLPIVGIVPDYVSDRGSVLVNRRVFLERWRESTVSRILVAVEPSASIPAVRDEIQRRFGDRHRLKVLTLREVLQYHADMIDRAFAFTDALQLLIGIVTVAGIFDLLLSSIVERRREIALWRLIGADGGAVRRSIVLESATIGILGAALGVAAGLVTAWLWVRVNFRYLLGYHLEYHLALGVTAWYVALVLVLTVATGFSAAAQAARDPIVGGIRAD